ncbi:hypothetical protein VTO73DRAFT_12860 [Trametes versicolor]
MLPAQKVTATPVKTTKSSLPKEMQAQEAVKVDVAQNAAVRRARQQIDASTGSASEARFRVAIQSAILAYNGEDISPSVVIVSHQGLTSRQIPIANATRQYRLQKKHFDDLLVGERPKGRKRLTYLYKERDVECKAWELRGGPEGLEKFLRHLWEVHIEKGGSPDSFDEPRYYRVSTDPRGTQEPDGSVGRLSSPTETGPDMFTGRSRVLLAIKRHMDGWLWKVCNEALVMEHPAMATEHADIMRCAIVYILPYPTRPAQLPPSSPAMDYLRAMLASATRYRKDDTDAQRVGLQYTGVDDPKVIDDHGMGELGWESARWEVYDTRGLHYDPRPSERKWNDHSFRWLDKDYLQEGLEWYCHKEYSSDSDSIAHYPKDP